MNKQQILGKLKKRILYFDGAYGTLIQETKVKTICGEILNLDRPEIIESIHQKYAKAGADIIIANTFGANRLKLKEFGLQNKIEEINREGIKIARRGGPKCIIAGDISEPGQYIEPLGELSFEKAYEIYKEQIGYLSDADILLVETISDIKIMKAAVMAAKESGKLVISSMTFEDGRSPTGTDVKSYVKIVDALGVDIIGTNCSTGPKKMLKVAKIILANTNKPVMVQPNAGIPKLINGKTVFPASPALMGKYAAKFAKIGVNLIGGCCGNTPKHIEKIISSTKNMKPLIRNLTLETTFSSRTRTIESGKKIVIIGERINPSGQVEFQNNLKKGKTRYVREEAILQKKEGAVLLDVNAGFLGADEEKNLSKCIEATQEACDLPIVIDTSNIKALKKALITVNGKALINSVNGGKNSMEQILPLAAKYGAGIITLCLDEKGIPKNVAGRVKIAKRIISKALKYGINSSDIIVDCVTMTVATDSRNEQLILDSVKAVKDLGYKTILGLSNISYGMPNRTQINKLFFEKAKKIGLDFAIMNPNDLSKDIKKEKITKKEKVADKGKVANKRKVGGDFENPILNYSKMSISNRIESAIIFGDSESIIEIIVDGLKEISPFKINDIMISALEKVGTDFQSKKIFLPQVLKSAKTVKLASKKIKLFVKKQKIIKKDPRKTKKIIIATVENDVHDLGKNILIMVLESYGYDIIDLGKNVPCNKIIKIAIKEKADLIALSALMTTTAPETEKVILKLKSVHSKIPVIIGGAVIDDEYAKSIGASYSGDAISTLKIIRKILK